MDIAILIPAYRPDRRLVDLVDALSSGGLFEKILIVDDGSGSDFRDIFVELAAKSCASVIQHAVNLGKGAALKTGMSHLLAEDPSLIGFVTADADGQHTLEDISKVGERLRAHPYALVLGARAFEGNVPLRSRIGNGLTKLVFAGLIGLRLDDTQTGLRGIPAKLIPHLLRLQSNRYEFETEMLVEAVRAGVKVAQVRIATVYYGKNEGTHFNPFFDSLRIFFSLLRNSVARG